VSRRRGVRLAVAVLVVAAVVAGVLWWHHERTADPYADYCQTADDNRALISAAVGEGATTGLIDALPSFTELESKAPADIAADWHTVVKAITGLVDALHAAGVDPDRYDRAHPPSGLSPSERDAIDAAAAELGSAATSTALANVDQEVRDVCHTPLAT